MTDLTEQYKHGKLPDDRYYYYRFKGEPDVQITTQYGLYCEEEDNKKEIEVIDFVPSYEEWQALNGNMDSVMQTNQALCKKLSELKELLKEIRRKIKTIYDMDLKQFITSAAFTDDFVKKIDEVLNA